MKKFAAFVMGLLTLSMVSVAHAGGSATMSLSPTNVNVSTGENFSITVSVSPNGEEIDTARAYVSYSASLVEVISFDLGTLFPSEAPGNTISNSSGLLSQGAFKFGDPVVSNGTLGTITFRALSSGATTIKLTEDSKLIRNGEEMINASSLNSVVVSIDGASVEPVAPTTETSTNASYDSSSAEEKALVYFGAFAGRMPSSSEDWDAHECIAYDSCNPGVQNLTREQQSLELYTEKYGELPFDSIGWNAIHAIAYTNVFIDWGDEVIPTTTVTETTTEETTATTEASLEEQALVYFGAFYARMPESSDDWNALHCIAYGGCQEDPQNLSAEEAALVIFGQKYAKMPSTSMEWNVVHTLAYTDFLDTGETEQESQLPTEETTYPVSSVQEELSLEQQAIGWFGKLTGYLPQTDADWLAVDYMVNGYVPNEQDLDLEAQAIAKFAGTFGYLPNSDQDWNIISAIAYSGAIL